MRSIIENTESHPRAFMINEKGKNVSFVLPMFNDFYKVQVCFDTPYEYSQTLLVSKFFPKGTDTTLASCFCSSLEYSDILEHLLSDISSLHEMNCSGLYK